MFFRGKVPRSDGLERGKVPSSESTNIKKHVFSQLFNTQISPSGICTFRACPNHDFRLYFDDVLKCFCLLGAMLMPQNRVQAVQDAKVYTLLICSKTIRSEERFLCSGRTAMLLALPPRLETDLLLR